VIQFDRRGTGLSDRTAVAPAIHDHVSDLVAVLGAVVAQRPVLFGTLDGAAAAIYFAATRPRQVASLILYASFAKAIHDDPACPGIAISEELMLGSTDERWGDPWLLDIAAPSKTTDPAFVEWWSRYQRASAGPAAARALISGVAAIDVRDLLPKVQAPTLVLHREGDRLVPIANGRFVADAIPGAQFVARPETTTCCTPATWTPSRRPSRCSSAPGQSDQPKRPPLRD
jgi:pimeloyl-ACP methyl ester carboxylesterase